MKHNVGPLVVIKVTGSFCQDCKYHRNNPGTCTKKHQWMARNSWPCEHFEKK